MRRRPAVLASLLLAAALALTGCSSDSTSTTSTTPAASAELAATGDFGEKPELTFPAGDPPAELTTTILVEGDGTEISDTDVVVVNYLGQVWGGEPFDNSYDKGQPFVTPLNSLVPGWAKGLTGLKSGSRVLLTLPPADGYGEKGNPGAGIEGTDTIVFVVDLIDRFGADTMGATDAVPDAAATASAAATGITVEGDLGDRAFVTVAPGTPVPTSLVTTVLATGTGEPITEGQIVAHYSGVDWTTNESIGDSWTEEQLQLFPVMADQDPFSGLIGLPLGSRVLLQVAPAGGGPAVAVVIDTIAQP